MKLLIITLGLLCVSNASKASDFYTGFVSGLQLDPSAAGPCANTLLLLSQELSSLYSNSINLMNKELGAYTQTVLSIEKLVDTLKTSNTNCDLSGFFSQVFEFTSEAGRKAMFKNYMNNVELVDNLGYNVYHCSSNFKTCGNSLGQLIHILTGANLSTKFRLGAPITTSQVLDFYLGLGLTYVSRASKTPLCQGDVLRLLPGLKKIINDFTMEFQEADDLLMIQIEHTVVTTCWKTDWSKNINQSHFIDYFKVLFDVKAWQYSYFMNTAQIDELLRTIEHCQENTAACGAAFPQLVSLIQPWVNYH